MRNWFRNIRRARDLQAVRRHSRPLRLEALEDRNLLSGNYVQTNLVSDTPGLAATTDANLVNPWGLAYAPTGPWWVANNVSGASTLYTAAGTPESLVVATPPLSGSATGTLGSPTGMVFNSAGSGFNVSETTNGVTTTGSSSFLFASFDGAISGWSFSANKTNAIAFSGTVSGASYTGLAFDTDSLGRNLLYAADNFNQTIDVYASSSTANVLVPTTVPGGFVDPSIKASSLYTPFNIQNIGGLLYVSYEKLLPDKSSDIPGVGLGFVDVFNSDGVLQQHLIAHGVLNEPWGLAVAPANFGAFSNDLLVGNDGDGLIHAFNPHTGQLVGTMTDGQGKPIKIGELWALKFGNGGAAGSTNTLYYTAGIPAGETEHGLFGSIQAIAPLATKSPIVASLAGAAKQSFSTEQPANTGDQNPYGVAFVPNGVPTGGKLAAGDTLVSNFNTNGGAQGTGSSIVEFGPNGQPSVFFQGQSGLGLTTALSVLSSGYVIVGSAPNNNSTTSPSVLAGSLLVLDKNGNVVLTLTNASLNGSLLNGPWDLAVHDLGASAVLFVDNVLSGTITRITLTIPKTGSPTVKSATQIASGYATAPNSAALVVGPTGLAYNAATDTLYVASTADNEIFSIAHASTTIDKGKGTELNTTALPLNGPLGLVLAPNGDLIVANGDAINTTTSAPAPNLIIEFTPAGKLVSTTQVDTGAAGAAFGIAVSSSGGEIRFAAVDDNTNTLDVWTFV